LSIIAIITRIDDDTCPKMTAGTFFIRFEIVTFATLGASSFFSQSVNGVTSSSGSAKEEVG